ncbi:hypothetical protein FRC08_017929, partial [Ceratobasidium sp. 394]
RGRGTRERGRQVAAGQTNVHCPHSTARLATFPLVSRLRSHRKRASTVARFVFAECSIAGTF